MALEKYVSDRRLAYFKSKIESLWKVKQIKVNGSLVNSYDAGQIAKIQAAEISSGSHPNPDPEVQQKILDEVNISGGSMSYGAKGGSIAFYFDNPSDYLLRIHAEGEGVNDGLYDEAVVTKTYLEKNMPLLETEETTIGEGYNLAAIKHNKTNDKSGIVIKKPNADTAQIDWFGANGTSENSVTLPTKDYVDTNGGKIDKIKVNGTEQTITNKEVDLTVPTMNGGAGDFVAWNGKTDPSESTSIQLVMSRDDYVEVQTKMADGNGTATETLTHNLVNKEYVDRTFRTEAQVEAAIAEAQTGAFVKVASYDDLPSEGAAGKIYLVPNSGSGQNVYDEYIWCIVAMMAGGGGGESPVYGYEKIGTTAVDLSGYVKESDLVEITEAEIDAMFA